ncbi:vacuolar sorting-associated protein [Trichodelitschia bisporula]|uniref:Vacuolar sorting-associated protein n=1 Tax=Trichodelitschia bisporula TaxID=703511 RepID=A0A6G1I931_9PEZI|nr:vacuolar sorting-associated protein [Trichodelitschia bisporula]
MSIVPASGYVPASDFQDASDAALPIFNVERVQLQFSRPSDFVAAQVANNAIILAFSTGRILRIDLENAGEIEDIDLPKKASEVGVIRRMFLDPTASHLLISTSLGENFYLHSQSKHPKPLSRLKGVSIECVAWHPSQPTASTREILLGTLDGNVYETYIEPSQEFYRREEKYVKGVYKAGDAPVVGIYADTLPSRPNAWRVLVATPQRLLHFAGKAAAHAHEGSAAIFSRFFEHEAPAVRENGSSAPGACMLAISPETQGLSGPEAVAERSFAWLSSQGVLRGKLLTTGEVSDLGERVFSEAKLLPRTQLPPSIAPSGRPRATQEPATSMILSQWHILQLVEGRIVGTNVLDDAVVLDQLVLAPGQSDLGLFADVKKNTFWLLTREEVFEIAAHEESRDIWRIMLAAQQFDAASQYARDGAQKNAVATASGDYLVNKGQFLEAAAVYGRSAKPFEQVALTFIDKGEHDALRKYLLTKLATLKKAATMQRVMVAAWLVELYMAKLNELDDTITTKAELAAGVDAKASEGLLSVVRKEFQEFATRYRADLDVKTTYEVISSHGREEELLFFATAVQDHNYVLAYWVQRERWPAALDVLQKQSAPETFYKYAAVLMAHVPAELVDILMRQTNLDPERLIPALLHYTTLTSVSLSQNQAVRYLNFVITSLDSLSPAVHNTLISIYAAAPTRDESALLAYLRANPPADSPYDADFALRLCMQHTRVHSCVQLHTSMGSQGAAVALALAHNEIDLAASVADTAPPASQKKLWLAIARQVIRQEARISSALSFLQRCPLLRIEDLIPFFPDFVLIDDFKEEICHALEGYSAHIDGLKADMDAAARAAGHIRSEVRALRGRCAVVAPGEKCFVCRMPLVVRAFFVFPCQHAFHADCLAGKVVELAGLGKGRRIRELQGEIANGVHGGRGRERKARELDELVGGSCVLCSELAVKQIDVPFVSPNETVDEWAL